MERISRLLKLASFVTCLLVLSACGGGGGGGSSSMTTGTLSGVAAVGTPIVNGNINVVCAAGSALPSVTTTNSTTGAFSVTLSGQTLPCAVQVSGGTINGITNTTPYHSIATATGTVNVTPLTDLLVANLAGTAAPSTWFAGLSGNSAPLTAITPTKVAAALANVSAALPALAPLSTTNPITTTFTPTSGNASDDMLTALATALANTGITYPSLLSNASTPSFTAPVSSFGIALTTAYTGTTSGGGSGAASYTVGGAVSGLTGTVVLQDNGGDNLSVLSNGTFTFASQVANGSTYGVTVLTQPAGQTCSVSTGAGTVSGANVTNVSLVCATNSYTVGGSVTGLTGSVVLQDNNGDNLTVAANGTFTFASKVANGSPYSVTVLTHPASQSCSVANGNGTIALANISNVVITCATNNYTIGGTVTGLKGSMVLQDNSGDNLTVSTNGNFSFATTVAYGNAYSVTVLTQPAGQTCSVSTATGTVSGGNVTNVGVVCSTNTYNVGGTVSGLVGTLVLQDNNGDNLTVTANGTFTFATKVANGSPYSVTALTHPASQSCSVASGAGTIALANVNNVAITCATNTYTIGGTVTGLNGSMVLQDNNGDNLTVSTNGSFSFATAIASGSAYSVSVLSQPAAQTCTVSTGAGTVSGANVTNVSLVCSTNSYTIGGSVTGLTGTVVLQDNNGDNLTIAANGTFTFATKVASASPYSVTVLTQPAGQICTISTGAGTVSGANVTNVSLACSPISYTVGGSVTGLVGSVVLQDNNGDNLTVATNGTFTFATKVANASPYSVTILSHPASQSCSVANGSGSIALANVSNVTVTCANISSYTIGGTVIGLTGSVVLQDNNGDNLTVTAYGSFNFPTAVAYGNPYNVSVLTQPSSQTCSVTGGSGTTTASVTSVVVNCMNTNATTSHLNGTGVTSSQCYQAGSDTLVSCSSAAAIALNNAQDGMAPANGLLGFSFTAVTGGCVLDNNTGLMWEVKTTDGGLRDWTKTYTNYDSTSALQYWVSGSTYVAPTQAQIDASTNSVGFVTAVNATNLCGYSNWRLPTADELQSIVDYGVGSGPTVDVIWFPNTQANEYWSASPFVGGAFENWGVNFGSGGVNYGNLRHLPNYVRLVRAGL